MRYGPRTRLTSATAMQRLVPNHHIHSSVLAPSPFLNIHTQARNDDRKHNPCLKAFEDLSEGERRYDYDMALETLSTLVALGYQISSNDEGQSPVAYMDLPPEKYELSNGYLPCPLNLESVTLDPALLQLVEKLAENAHNIWAASRIREGWSYGKATVSMDRFFHETASRYQGCVFLGF